MDCVLTPPPPLPRSIEPWDLWVGGQSDLSLCANYECDLVKSPQRLQKSGCVHPEYSQSHRTEQTHSQIHSACKSARQVGIQNMSCSAGKGILYRNRFTVEHFSMNGMVLEW